MKHEIQTRQNDLALQERQKEIMEKELKHSVAECEDKALEIRSLQSHLAKKKDENSILSTQVKDLRTSVERSIKENRLLETRFNRLQSEYQAQVSKNLLPESLNGFDKLC